MDDSEPLTMHSPLGAFVHWNTLGGERLHGHLKERDNGTAIILMPDGSEKAVRCT